MITLETIEYMSCRTCGVRQDVLWEDGWTGHASVDLARMLSVFLCVEFAIPSADIVDRTRGILGIARIAPIHTAVYEMAASDSDFGDVLLNLSRKCRRGEYLVDVANASNAGARRQLLNGLQMELINAM